MLKYACSMLILLLLVIPAEIKAQNDDITVAVKPVPILADRAQNELKPVSQVVFQGNQRFDDEELKEVINIKPKDIPCESFISDSVENIKGLYAQKEKGFSNIEIMTSVVHDGYGFGVLTYYISERGKIYIKQIKFDGNEVLSDQVLSNIIETFGRNFFLPRKSGFGKLNFEQLVSDSKRLQKFYHNSGFLQAQVGSPYIFSGDDGGLIITFPLVEGQRFKVGTISLGGEMLPEDNLEAMQKPLKTNAGIWFSREVMLKDVQTLQTYYSDRGYPHNTVEPNITGPHDGNKFNLEFIIQPKNKVYN